ncbi:uncharacterized protein FTJAE_14190 [Fusarium tjaetaba]|uniref:Uncharacterized protein n=1 Tax=Fusarium tjaetaba TaxID=1567544 RepID=A0A8H5QCK3_9HYPO|nr:uncharacterized protein FTJAE_14190 [Fusarium tjaetaba]KAF5611528.1 hypothetical protein FTJAE_14190 [Fusarium tjaetaba]
MAPSSLTEPDAAAAVSSESSTRGRFYSILRKPASNLALRISDLDRYRLNMWEVSWAAPKESRKEHRENKAATAKSATKARSIFSRGSNSSNEAPSFGNFYNKRKNAERGNDSVSSTSSKASAGAGNYELEADEASTFSAGSEQTTMNMARVVDLSARRNGQIMERSQEVYIGDNTLLEPPSPTLTSSSAPWDTETLERVIIQPWPLIQALSDDSFIARSTEATTSQRTSYDTPYLVNCGVTIMATPSFKSKHRARSPSTQSQPQRPQSSRSPTKAKTPRRMPSSTASLRVESSDSWQPPSEWACTPTEPSFQFPDEPVPEPEATIPKELNAMQLGVKQLAKEDNMIRLVRLAESQGVNNPPGLCQDLEVEKMQWMLSAMFNMDGPEYSEINDDDLDDESADPPKRILALYETPAVTSYLAAVNHSKQVYHLSAAPLSPASFPNIHPVLTPVRSPSAFPVAPSTIEAVHSLRLPLAMPSQDIPALLRNIHRCLEPGGSLQLTIIDPLPVTSTLGPLLRAWIEDHLLFNLEASFRCTNPSKLLPLWLNGASLHVDPDSIETTQFFAIPLDNTQLQYVREGHISEEGMRQELRNLVGRMLWMEVWREYIVAERWWWEDPEILQECIQHQTMWEWKLIEAVKDT